MSVENIIIMNELNSIEIGFTCQICEGTQSGTHNGFPVCNNCKTAIKELIQKKKCPCHHKFMMTKNPREISPCIKCGYVIPMTKTNRDKIENIHIPIF